jgi:ABC-type transport system involved in cytochrome bd biosynthesis fused ATPase/permease subunit
LDGCERRIGDHENMGMKLLSFAYRFLSNFVFLALVYFSLNFMEKYQQRAVVAILVLVYAAMRAASALRSFYFFQRIERLEVDARRLAATADEGPTASASRKQIVGDVTALRRIREMNAYIDLLFLAMVVLLCVSKIVTN